MGFKPLARCSWDHRFDDPRREFRTAYGSFEPLTAIRETLQALRADVKMLAEFQAVFGRGNAGPPVPRRAVSLAWRRQHALVLAKIEAAGPVIDLEGLELRRELEAELAPDLAALGVSHLDLSELRGRDRPVTQLLARHLFTTHGAAGVSYRSHLDSGRCVALFEGRTRLAAAAESIPLTEPLRELHQVCAEFGVELDGAVPEASWREPLASPSD